MDTINPNLRISGPATATIDVGDAHSPITVIGNDAIRQTFDDQTIQQAINSRLAPGVTDVVLNPDAHVGYGAPVGCVMLSPTHVYPGPVGVDIKCSMSLLQTDIPADEIVSQTVRRKLIQAIGKRVPSGAGRGQRHVPKSRPVDGRLGFQLTTEGASKNVLKKLGIPKAWADRCEDWHHTAPDGSSDTLAARLEFLGRNRDSLDRLESKYRQLGSYGGGNHFGEAEVVRFAKDQASREVAQSFGLRDGHVAFLSHCGSRGLGHDLAMGQFRSLKTSFQKQGLAFPAGDPQLVYADARSDEGRLYLCDMAMGANFATVNHLMINQLVLEAFREVFPSVRGELVYFISHNIVRQEQVGQQLQWVHRKGATRAFPARHPGLQRTPFAETGHPILLPGNPRDGSSVMVALPGAERSAFSVNHGAGRRMSRTKAKKMLDQHQIDTELMNHDILSNCRQYPRDEAPDAYKDFNQVLASVEQAGLATEVARLEAKFVIKDGAPADD
ncbi:RNA-splicing ligase RtcB [Rubripirellula lacrimiformis]|uniref:tRNA-splicing ligase RtcB n=1 Tax=Rubripirellula lacrimiformis TaxID=1930273 RepID=A0A517NI44_9BACT|nr:RtcB family protein [Rubripirellula lacrimiformis]QDT06806.1 RNA-splicing ligase RtcB [Rubripirellula lacrimiformis]